MLLGLVVGAVRVPVLRSVTSESHWEGVQGVVLSSAFERSVSQEINANDNRDRALWASRHVPL
ncbi:hypothetical protein E7T06_04960 [Deinococcus sp. Arct2-2]|uniref:hypothetical protein n=1 Tax=Deinococcus sp. Arct2-2 TaxID=2568653 RepID=UPI0010A47FD6|nr:hypothetical protein [Deinococcus sp. Arct2-2]THF70912.1 hypothetical protein E7T06_04960 [Deinococcus sp. Arct2-2]